MMNQNELIQNFFGLTGTFDEEIAFRFLSENNWNLEEAFNAFERNESAIPQHINEPNESDIPQEPSIGQYIKGALNWVFSPVKSFVTKNPQPIITFQSYLKKLAPPSYPRLSISNLSQLEHQTKTNKKPALVYIHNADYGDVFVRTVLCNIEIISIINSSYLFLGLIGDSDEGSFAISQFSEDNTVIFAIVKENTVLGRLEYLPSADELLEFLFTFLENPQISEDRLIRQRQDEELKQMEKVHYQQLQEEKQKLENLKKQQEAENQKLIKAQELQDSLTAQLGPEPEAGPGVTHLTFKLPSGDKLERRFLEGMHTDLVKVYLKTKGINDCDLLAGFPPQSLPSSDLKEAGLTPRGLIHVRMSKSS